MDLNNATTSIRYYFGSVVEEIFEFEHRKKSLFRLLFQSVIFSVILRTIKVVLSVKDKLQEGK